METKIRDNTLTVPFNTGNTIGVSSINPKNMAWVETVREITSRLAIYRKLKDLGHSDESIFTIYKKSNKLN